MECLQEAIIESGLPTVLVGMTFQVVKLLALWHLKRRANHADGMVDLRMPPG